jgi:putative transposase
MKAQTHVRLSQTDVKYLEGVIGTGKPSARQFKRAMALLELNRGKTITSVAETLGVTPRTVGRLRDRYVSQGLACLEDQPRSGRPIKIDGTQRAKITALACSAAPSGRGQWALRLLADKVVELGISDRISHTQVGHILKKTR